MAILCESLKKLLHKSLSSCESGVTNKLIARQTVERDFLFFDGHPEEWPTFYA